MSLSTTSISGSFCVCTVDDASGKVSKRVCVCVCMSVSMSVKVSCDVRIIAVASFCYGVNLHVMMPATLTN